MQLLWQTGKAYFADAEKQAAPFAADNLRALEFVRRMDLAYAAADVVVSRAGALSVSELCLTGKPSVLVPSPNVAEDHQTKNALALTSKDAALLVRDTDAAATLYNEALALLQNHARQQQLAANIRQLARPHATATIVDELLKLVSGS